MKTRLYYSFMVGTALAMGNIRSNPESLNRPAILTVLDSKSPAPAQGASAPSENDQTPSVTDQASASQHDQEGGITLTA